ncbi:uncharacterized protein LOC115734738 isoform X2 [Rhodamnia argentea]|uniref:Uncharacterized protein LOC115734738 isoform X2 n=1 Tax=Rhodamnia argentea TaxID=178133 RepID=A0ABM3HQ40_9MYRT|nr:uncharacterized protein LOC115734738 isoform X2 [Rhodamnia argentea]
MLTYDSHTHHPSHPHRLKLLTTPAYPSGRFICNGCRQQGSGFGYHCAECRFDLHIVCASKPLRIHDQSHRHEHHLAFNCPYETGGFRCNVCGAPGGNHWLYRCSSCNFDVHLECAVVATARPAQVVPPAPQQASYAVARWPAYISSGLNHQYQYQTHTFLGQSNMQGVIHNPNGMNIWSSQHQAQPAMRPSAIGFGAFTVAAAAEQGLVEGIAQQVGQSVANCVMDSSGGGGGGGGGSIFDVSSFLDFS